MPMSYRVLIADDHPIVRQGIKQLLEETPDLRAAGEAQTGDETLTKVRTGGFDLLLLDLNMPGPHGLELLERVRQERPQLPILVLSMHGENQFAARILKAGASGYIAKESAPEELIRAIRKAGEGKKYISESFAQQLADALDRPAVQLPHETLSRREYQVLLLIGAGKQPKEIAAVLQLSAKTVSTYRARILEKMRMGSNAALIQYAIRQGLVS